MKKRVAIVDTIYTTSIANSSIFSIGDTGMISQRSKAIALQKEGVLFKKSDNLYFKDYEIFKREAIWPKFKTIVNSYNVHNCTDTINLRRVNLTALSLSSVFQVGSINNIAADSRVKHFRILQED